MTSEEKGFVMHTLLKVAERMHDGHDLHDALKKGPGTPNIPLAECQRKGCIELRRAMGLISTWQLRETMSEAEYSITCTNLLPIHTGHWSEIDQWQLAQIAPCPNCGGHTLLWAENGNVPGYRICGMCGRTWMVKGHADGSTNTVTVRFTVPETDRGPEWKYGEPDTSDEAYLRYSRRVEAHGGSPYEQSTWAHYQK